MTDILHLENRALGEKSLTFRHKSGLTVWISPKGLTTDYAVLSVNYGSMHTSFRLAGEKEMRVTPSGIAHFLEHKMFDMPDGTDAFEAFAAIGANANAYTSVSRTSYLFSCTSHFEEALEILMRMLLTPVFTEAGVARERDIIKQEILAGEDQAAACLYRSVMRGLFDQHEIRRNICGTVASIGAITPELLYLCHSAFYIPSRMVLSLSGSMEAETVVNVLDRVFDDYGHQSGVSVGQVPLIEERAPIKQSYEELSMSVAKPMIELGIKDVAYPTDAKEMARRQILADMALSAVFGCAGALYEELHDQGLLQECFSTDYTDEPGCAYALVVAETAAPDIVLSRMYEAIEQAGKEPPSRQEFERLRRCFYADYVRLFDSTEEIAEEMLDNFFSGVDLLDVGDMVLQVTYEEFRSLVSQLFKRELCTASVVRPLENITTSRTDDQKEKNV